GLPPTSTVPLTSSLFVSIRETVPSVWLVTTSVLPFSLTAQPRGSSPTGISLIARHPLPVRVTTETVPLAELVTYAFCPETATQVGSCPTVTSSALVRSPAFLPTSNTVRLFASRLTLKSRLPCLLSAMLLERDVVLADAGGPIGTWPSRAIARATWNGPTFMRISVLLSVASSIPRFQRPVLTGPAHLPSGRPARPRRDRSPPTAAGRASGSHHRAPDTAVSKSATHRV